MGVKHSTPTLRFNNLQSDGIEIAAVLVEHYHGVVGSKSGVNNHIRRALKFEVEGDDILLHIPKRYLKGRTHFRINYLVRHDSNLKVRVT